MSGIAGIYYLDGRPVERADLERMVESMRHRGPDGSGVWRQGPVGLGHVLLHSTPEARYEQSPMQDASGQLVITADVRLDNREELLAALDFEPAEASTIPDSRLILAAYEKWGERCPEKLLGDFAFAIWDNRQKRLFCARDHLGAKPLFYYSSHRFLAFGSEIKALLALSEVPRRVNEEWVLHGFQLTLGMDLDTTSYQGIYRFKPGQVMLMDRQGLRTRTYWTPEPAAPLPYKTDRDFAEAFRHLFTEAVRCRLRSTTAVGVMLSGGVDSGSIACVARQLVGNQRLLAFSGISDDGSQCLETKGIQAVTRKCGIDSYTVAPSQIKPFIQYLKESLSNHDEYYEAWELLIPAIVYQLARRNGVKVMLDGLDGDLLASLSNGYLSFLLKEGKLKILWREATGLAKRLQAPLFKVLLRQGLLPLAPRGIKKLFLRLRPLIGSAGWEFSILNPVINPEFAQRQQVKKRLEIQGVNGLDPEQPWGEMSRRLFIRGTVHTAMENFDRKAFPHSIEPRHPLLDKRLVEFCLALPWEQRVQGGMSKVIFRRAMQGILPPEVQWRGDRNDLSAKFLQEIFLNFGEIMDLAIAQGREAIKDYVNLSALSQIQQRFPQVPWYDGLRLWSIASLALWLKEKRLSPP